MKSLTKAAATKLLHAFTCAGFFGAQIHDHFYLTVSVTNPYGGEGQEGREDELRAMCAATGLQMHEYYLGSYKLTYGEARMMVPPQSRPF